MRSRIARQGKREVLSDQHSAFGHDKSTKSPLAFNWTDSDCFEEVDVRKCPGCVFSLRADC
jgi:hypothetical protein